MINNLHEAFEILKDYKKILIVGPQRSGTTIASKIFAKKLNLQCIDEIRIKCSREDLYLAIINTENNFVLQCPSMSHCIHKIGNRDDLFIIFMMRDIHDIICSQERIRWNYCESEKKIYIKEGFNINMNAPISVVRHHVWRTYQKDKIKNKIELWYECLKVDELWVDKEFRKNFKPKTTHILPKEEIEKIKADRLNARLLQENKSIFKKI